MLCSIKKVVILEFDLRKPRLSKNLGLDTKSGLSSYLTREAKLEDLLIEIPGHGGDNFFLLPSGPIPPNPAELILGNKMGILMNELEQKFDYIILDTPPFSVVTDATLLQSFSDISIVVLRQGYSFKSVYEILNQRLFKYLSSHYMLY
jgi:Mrp family chromosome partitioning ATPase